MARLKNFRCLKYPGMIPQNSVASSGGSLPVERMDELRPLVTAIRQGIDLGLR